MYFEVESGEGSPTANAYTTVSDADDYITLHEDDIERWMDLDEERKEILIIRATKFLDTMLRWQGAILEKTQALAWPREKFKDNEGREVEGIPQAIKDATASLAFTSLEETLSTDVEKLIRSDFGDTSDTYATPVTIGNPTVQQLTRNLILMGYGRNRVSIVEAVRG